MDVPRGPPRYLLAGFVLLFAAGLVQSLLIAFGAFGPDADVSQAAMLWHGMQRHGPRFLQSWIFTADNWLFSLYPVTFGLFAIVGPQPYLPVLIGWLILVSSVLACGAIARALGASRAALVVPALLACSGLYAHHAGFLAYPVSHNVTNLYGLAAMLCLLRWVKTRKVWLAALVVLLLTAGGLSDPWIVAAYALPLTLTCILLAFLSGTRDERRASVALAGALLLCIAAIETRAFGSLAFLTPFHFVPGNPAQIAANSLGALRDVGGLLNVVPGTASNRLPPALISVCAVGALIAGVIRLIPTQTLRDDPLQIAFCSTIALSLGGMVSALVISETPVAANSARFLVNVLYLTPTGIAVLLDLHWDRASRALRRGSMLAAALFALAGFVSGIPVWRSPSLTLADHGAGDLLKFLADNDLRYGYGPYWGAHANSATWVSGFKTRIRPVVFDRATGTMRWGRRAQTSPLWYLPSDMPEEETRFFVLVRDDTEECPDVRLCITGVVGQFGPPERTLQYRDATILVWPRLPPASSDYLDHSIGDRLRAGDLARSRGWSAPEGESVWSDGEVATILLRLADTPRQDLELSIEGHAFVNARSPRQEIEVSVNGRLLATLSYDSDAVVTRSVRIPRDLAAAGDGRLMLQFGFRDARSPAELGLSGDLRRLGLAFVSLQLKPAAS